MILGRLTPAQKHPIKEPKWSSHEVLIAKFRVGTHNEVEFTSESAKRYYPDKYYISGEKIRQFPLGSNGKIQVYYVPLDELEPLERSVE